MIRLSALFLSIFALVTSSARAGVVDLLATFPDGSNASLGKIDLYVFNSLDTPIGAIKILVAGGDSPYSGAHGFTLDLTNPGISAADSQYLDAPVPGFDFDELIIENLPGQAIGPAHSYTRLGRFVLNDPFAFTAPFIAPGETVLNGAPVFEATLYDVAGQPIIPQSIELIPSNGSAFSGVGIRFVPEPGVTLLLLFGLAGLRALRTTH